MLYFNGGTAAQPYWRGRSRINEGGQEGGGQHFVTGDLALENQYIYIYKICICELWRYLFQENASFMVYLKF